MTLQAKSLIENHYTVVQFDTPASGVRLAAGTRKRGFADGENANIGENDFRLLPGRGRGGQQYVNMVIGHDEAAGARHGGNADGYAAHAGGEHGGEIALIGANELLLADRLTREELEACHGAG